MSSNSNDTDVSKRLLDLKQYAIMSIASFPMFYDPLAISGLVANEMATRQQQQQVNAG